MIGPEDVPLNVWKWIRKYPSLVIILSDGVIFADDVPEAAQAMNHAYRQYISKKANEEEKKRKKTQAMEKRGPLA